MTRSSTPDAQLAPTPAAQVCRGAQHGSVQERDRLSRAERFHAAQPRDTSKGETTTPCSYKDEMQTTVKTTLKPAPSLNLAPKAANPGLGGRCATSARGRAARDRAPLPQGTSTRRMWVCKKVQPSAAHRERCQRPRNQPKRSKGLMGKDFCPAPGHSGAGSCQSQQKRRRIQPSTPRVPQGQGSISSATTL